jgi:hypothetical protein
VQATNFNKSFITLTSLSFRKMLQVEFAVESDARRIAEIHMTTLGSNHMLIAQFPTPEARSGLFRSIEDKAKADIVYSETAVLVAINASPWGRVGTRQIVAFAKWSLPDLEEKKGEEPPWNWPPGTDLDVLEGWTARAEAVSRQVLGLAPAFRKSQVSPEVKISL